MQKQLFQKIGVLLTITFITQTVFSQNTRWNLTPDNRIVWNVKENDSHIDNIEINSLL